MRLRARNGFIHFVYGSADEREGLLTWKKAGNDAIKAGKKPKRHSFDFTELASILLDEGVGELDIITVPPPSFHDYSKDGGWYPAEILAAEFCEIIKKPLTFLWPERYTEKTKKNNGSQYRQRILSANCRR